MELEKIKNLENVKRYRQDICEASGIEFSADMITNDYFLGRFWREDINYLNSLGLLNRGFCLMCGDQLIVCQYSINYSNVLVYIGIYM